MTQLTNRVKTIRILYRSVSGRHSIIEAVAPPLKAPTARERKKKNAPPKTNSVPADERQRHPAPAKLIIQIEK